MNKLTLNEIVGYLPYGLKCNADDDYNEAPITNGELFRIETGKTTHNNSIFEPYVIIDDNEYELHSIKPILNRIEDFSLEELDKWIHIQETNQDNLQFSIQANEFMYSNHVDIHNLIDRGLAVDKKTIQP